MEIMKLISEFNGSGKQSVVEWLEKLELVCKLRGIADVASVVPLRLTDGAFAVYLQLSRSERKTASKVKKTLLAAFAVDFCVVYEQFVNRRLRKGESPDVYLAELRCLASLFGGVSGQAMACVFVAGLPEDVYQFLRAGSRREALKLDQILSWAQTVLKDDGVPSRSEACFGAAPN
ncbi:uncharacterized protein [Penaeus vannamei]|uniref:uncharacterized protein n=1 Tax=Penaeus vannamei TaxID=6689 RepID=UPI00387FAA1E